MGKKLLTILLLIFMAVNGLAQSPSVSPSGNQDICAGDSLRLNITGLNSSVTYVFKWFKNGSIVGDSTRSSFHVRQSGRYKAVIEYSPNKSDTLNEVNVTVNPKPTANFSFTQPSGCGSKTIQFSNSSTDGSSGTNLSYRWDFGNGKTSTDKNPSMTFKPGKGTGSDIFNIKLKVTNQDGCVDSITKQVSIGQVPDASLDGDNPSTFNGQKYFKFCQSEAATFNFNNLSTTIGSNTSYKIKWGDSSPDSTFTSFPAGVFIPHTYAVGTRTLVFYAYSGTCIDSTEYNIFIGNKPAGGIGAPQGRNICAGDSLPFFITSASANPPGTRYIFYVNDNSAPDTFYHPAPDTVRHTFKLSSCGFSLGTSFPNSFQAILNISNPCNVLGTEGTIKPIEVSDKPKPLISISPRDTSCVGQIITFTNTGNPGSNVQDGVCTIGKSVWKIFPATGWTLGAGQTTGNTNFRANPSSWTSGSTILSLNFNTPGVYEVRLVMGNNTLCGMDSVVKKICVNPAPAPAIDFNTNPICIGSSISPVATLNTPTCGNYSYSWGVSYVETAGCSPNTSSYNISNSNTLNPTIQFINPGTYTISFTAIAPGGACSTVVSKSILVKGKPTVTLPTFAPFCQVNSLSPSATVSCLDASNNLYAWTFQDGTPSTSSSASPGTVSFSNSGSKQIQLTVTNSCGFTTQSTSVTVNPMPVVAAITGSSSLCAGTTTTLTGPSGGAWTSSAPAFATVNASGVVTGIAAGTTTIRYTVTTNGCTTTVTKDITVSALPTISLQAISDICNSATSFTIPYSAPSNGAATYDLSTGPSNPLAGFTSITGAALTGSSLNINLGGGSLTAGSYGFTLTIKNANGCSTSYPLTLKISAPPSTANAGPDLSQCNNGNFTMAATAPVTGSGVWSLVSGSASIISPTLRNTTVSNLAAGSSATLRWTVSNNPCPASTDDIVIQNVSAVGSPTITGSNLDCNNDGFSLTGSSPAAGQTGTWSLVSGTAILPSDLTTPAIVVSGVPAGTNAILRWTLSNALCNSFKDITISNRAPILNNTIGPDQTICGTIVTVTGSLPTGGTLAGISPALTYLWQYKIGAGSWTNIPSPTGTTKDLTSYTISQSISFRRLVLGGNCSDTSNISNITVQPVVSNNTISSLQILCNNQDPAELIGTLPTGGGTTNYAYEWQVNTGNNVWTKVGDGINYDPASLSVPGNTAVIYTYRRIVTSPDCPTAAPLTSNTVTVQWNPDAKAEYNATILSRCAPFGITLNSNISLVQYATRNSQYNWRILTNDASKTILQSVDNSLTPPVYQMNQPNQSVILQLIAVSPTGCKNDTIQKTFTTNDNPTVVFVGDLDNSCSPMPVQMTNTSYLGTAGNNTGLTYQWYVNGVLQSTLANPLLSLSNASNTTDANVTVKLIATIQGSASCKDSSSSTFKVYPVPLSRFSIVNGDTCSNPNGVVKSVINTSVYKTGTISYRWKVLYSNGTIAPSVVISDTIALAPNFTFPSNSSTTDTTYTVSLEVTSVDGCKKTSTQSITIFRKPVVNFNLSQLSGCGPFTVNATDNTTNVSNTKLWSYASNVTGAPAVRFSSTTGINPVITIPENTLDTTIVYTIKQIATSVSGCKDSLSKTIAVYPKPKVAFNVPALEGCTPYSFTATSTSVAGNSESFSSLSHQWKVFKGATLLSTSNASNVSLVLKNAGLVDSTYDVWLIVTTQNGCKDSLKKTITVHGNARADYVTRNAVGCIPFNIRNEITLKQYPGVNSIYSWTVNGIAYPAGTTPPNYTITKDGDTAIVKLTATSAFGCLNNIYIDTFTTVKTPVTSFTKSVNEGCGPLAVTFTNNSAPLGGVNFSWNFGNGQTSTQVQPGQIQFLSSPLIKDTVYKIQLVASTSCASVTYVDSIFVRPKPKAIVAPDSTRLCSPVSVKFNNFSKGANRAGKGITYYWYFGDGSYDTTFTNVAVKHTYYNPKSVPDTFTMKMIAVNECGLDSNVYKIVVLPNDVVSELVIDGNNKTGCAPFSVKFFNRSKGATSYKWDFGDGITQFTSISPDEQTHIYDKPGVYRVSLFATNGCSDSTTYEEVTVLESVKPSFVTDKASYCEYDSIKFNNTSTAASANSYEWDFGDGTKSNAKNPVHKYADSGQYKVRLKVMNVGVSGIICEDIIEKVVKVAPPPNVNIVLSNLNGTCTPVDVRVKIDSQSAPIIKWYFEDGPDTDTVYNTLTAQHRFTNEGNYRIGVEVLNASGCFDSSSLFITIFGTPKPVFSASDSILCIRNSGPQSVTFINQTIVPNGQTYSYQWLIDGVPVSTDRRAYSHSFVFNSISDLPKNYKVTLRTLSSNGCVGDTTITIRFVPYPKASFSISSKVNCYDTKITATDADYLVPHTRSWTYRSLGKTPFLNIQNDTTRRLVLLIPKNTSDFVYSYEVKLEVISSGKCVDSVKDTIVVYPEPKIGYALPDTLCSDQSVSVKNLSIPLAGSALSQMKFKWILRRYNAARDTNLIRTSEDLDFVFRTSNSGLQDSTYFLTLIGTSPEGCISFYTRQFVVKPPVKAVFTYTPSISCSPARLVITSNDSRNATQFKWYINDKLYSDLKKPNDTILSKGGTSFIVKLLALSGSACNNDSIEYKVVTFETPVSAFDISDSTSCTGSLQLSPADRSFGIGTKILKWNWNFGDGTSSTIQNPIKFYNKPGAYKLSLTVQDERGCLSDTVIRNIIVYGKPKAIFTAADICIGDSMRTINKSTLGFGSTTFAKIEWSFGDGIASPVFEPKHKYNFPGEYDVRLIVYGDKSCVPDTLFQKVKVIGKPMAEFKWDIQCNLLPIQFTSTAANGYSDVIRSHQWLWSDGQSSTLKDPIILFKDTGSYKVKLKVNGTLCPSLMDSIEKTIKISSPRSPQTYSIKYVAMKTPYRLAAKPGGLKYYWTPSTGLDNPATSDPIAKYQLTSPGKIFYTIEITDSAGCKILDKQEVWVFEKPDIYLPTAFTPNGDGVNDDFKPLYVNISSIKYFRIFDRRGNLIVQTADMNFQWNGTVKGKSYPMDTYTWIILAVDKEGKELFRKGNVTLIRKE
jgi:gliding motility-associated-like protein